MSRVSSIVERVRDSLGDENATRFTDARLLRILDEAQKVLCLETYILTNHINYNFILNSDTYTLPDDCIVVLRAEQAGKQIPQSTHEELDKLSPDWSSQEAEVPTNIVFDKSNYNNFSLYPIPTTSSQDDFILVTSGVVGALDYSGAYGVLSFVTGSDVVYNIPEDQFGVVTSITYDDGGALSVSSDFGFVTTFDERAVDLKITYAKEPETIDSIYNDLEVHSIWDTAIKNYVLAIAFRDDRDMQNKELSNDYFNLFYSDVAKAKRMTEINHNSTTKHMVEYNNGFN